MKNFKYITFFLFVLSVLSGENAQAINIDAQGFKPHPLGFDASLPTVITGNTAEQKNYVFGIIFNYQKVPLSSWGGDENTLKRIVIGRHLTADLIFGMGISSSFDIGIAVPLILSQDGEGFSDENKPEDSGVGDISIYPRFKLYTSSGGVVSVAFIPVITLPVGHKFDRYMGSSFMTFKPTLAVTSYFSGRISVSYNFYYKAVSNEHIKGLDLEDEMGFGLGGVYKVSPGTDVFIEFYGHTLVNAPFDSRFNSPLEGDTGLKYRLNETSAVIIGGGIGIVKGYTAPDFRLYIGFGWSRKPNDITVKTK